MNRGRAIVITGPVGAGKTTTMWALADLLEERDVPVAAIDMDGLRWFHPRPADDRFGSRVGLHHLHTMATTYRELGISTLVLADVIETGTERHQEAMPGYDVIVVRLDVSIERLHVRLRQREIGAGYAWYENRAIELTEIMERNGIGDVVIRILDESPQQIAAEIATRLELPGY
jgi:ABC-type lipopolysaccharide export system ATPase subunit